MPPHIILLVADLRVCNLAKRFGGRTLALAGVDLEVPHGTCLAIVGPSGCGKSTLLRIIAGLEKADQGQVSLDDEPIDSMPPHRRGISMVFQDFPLYPHMSVRQNLAFPLKMRRVPRVQAEEAIRQASSMLGIEKLLDRKPGQLSGGEQQRVALGRVIVAKPKIALLDEPMSNLDARLRETLRTELRTLQKSLRLTMLFVTHDQREAAAVGDRLGVMMRGRIEQIGLPDSVLREPKSETVAEFLGVPMPT